MTATWEIGNDFIIADFGKTRFLITKSKRARKLPFFVQVIEEDPEWSMYEPNGDPADPPENVVTQKRSFATLSLAISFVEREIGESFRWAKMMGAVA